MTRVLFVVPGIGSPTLPVKAGVLEENARVIASSAADCEVHALVSFYSPEAWDERWLRRARRYFHDLEVEVARCYVGQFLRTRMTPERLEGFDYVMIVLDDVLVSSEFSLAEAIELIEFHDLDLLAAPLTFEGSSPHPIMLAGSGGHPALRRTNFCELFSYLLPTRSYRKYHPVLGNSAKWMWGVDQALAGLDFRMALSDAWPACHIFRRASRGERYQGIDEQLRAWGRYEPLPLDEAADLEQLDARPAPVTVAVARRELRAFERDEEHLGLPVAPPGAVPDLSVVLRHDGDPALLLRCLRSLAAVQELTLQLVSIRPEDGAENGLPGWAEDVLEVSDRVAALAAASGPFLLFLDTSCAVRPGAVEAAHHQIRSDSHIGVVGGALTRPNGLVHNAGAIVWRDGSLTSYGAGMRADDYAHRFCRRVDAVDGRFVMTLERVAERCFTADPIGQPFGPYDLADMCARVWKAGYEVVYAPRAIAELAAGVEETAPEARAQRRFAVANSEWLEGQFERAPGAVWSARSRGAAGRVLVVLDRVPYDHLGGPFPRYVQLVRALVELGHQVTLLPTSVSEVDWASVHDSLPDRVEVADSYGTQVTLEAHLAHRPGYYTHVLSGGLTNLELVLRARERAGASFGGAKVVFDADSDAAPGAAAGGLERVVDPELASRADCILAPTERVLASYERSGLGPVQLVRSCCRPTAEVAGFRGRSTFLFIGSMTHRDSPDSDAILWFLDEVWPRIVEELPTAATLEIVGRCDAPRVLASGSARVRVHDQVEDVDPYCDRARVAILPRRFGDGFPHGVLRCAARGVPLVLTPRACASLDWPERAAGIAEGAEDFATACEALYADEVRWEALRREAQEVIKRGHREDGMRKALARAMAIEATAR